MAEDIMGPHGALAQSAAREAEVFAALAVAEAAGEKLAEERDAWKRIASTLYANHDEWYRRSEGLRLCLRSEDALLLETLAAHKERA